jgi:hypothetical protein
MSKNDAMVAVTQIEDQDPQSMKILKAARSAALAGEIAKRC